MSELITKEELLNKFNNRYKMLTISLNKVEYVLKDKINITCKKCNHTWPSTIMNALLFYLGCYDCHKGQSYSMEEIKILKYIGENYVGEMTYQRLIYPKKCSIQGYVPPRYYSVDGYSWRTFDYKNNMISEIDGNGTVFEVLGDYYHSNPEYYQDGPSAKKNMNHRQNYEYTMNRLKNIEEQGYKVYYIWVSDFKRFVRDYEKGLHHHLFEYVNIEKKYCQNSDYSLLPKGSRTYFS